MRTLFVGREAKAVCALKVSDRGLGLALERCFRLVLTIQETRLVRSRLTGEPERGRGNLWTGSVLGKEEVAIIIAIREYDFHR